MTELKVEVDQVWMSNSPYRTDKITIAAVGGTEAWVRFNTGSHLTYEQADIIRSYKLVVPFFEVGKKYRRVDFSITYEAVELMEVEKPAYGPSRKLWALLKYTNSEGEQGFVTRHGADFPDFREVK